MSFRPLAHATLSVAVVALILTGCSAHGRESALVEQIDLRQGADVSLANVFTGEWDSFLVVCPYDLDVNERLGFDWPDAPDTTRSDSSQTVVLTAGDQVTSSTTMGFDRVDLCRNGVWQLESKDLPIDFQRNGAGIWVAQLPE